MSSRRETVVFSVVGSSLDVPGRRWRPTLTLLSDPDALPVTRLVLFVQNGVPAVAAAADRIEADARRLAPALAVERVPYTIADPWSFEEVYAVLYEYCRGYAWDERADYYVHITTGTHVMQIVWHQLIAEHYAPARLVQTRPDGARPTGGALHVIDLDLARYPALARRRHAERLAGQGLLKMGIATASPGYNAVIARLERAALGPPAPILLTGETGVGKSALARRVYELRRRARRIKGALVEVNCATLRGQLRESALFGHRKGAFTGAERDRRGFLAAADGGMLFLDEVGELGADEQALLLTAIEERRFIPLGADEPVASDFHLVCGTNRDLRAEVRAGRFRDDLLARIGVWEFALPPLRARLEDLEANVRYELERFEERYGSRARFSRAALARYLAFGRSPEARWPHNFRDLGQSVLRMACLADEGLIDTADVDAELATLRAAWSALDAGARTETAPPVDDPTAPRAMDRVDRVVRATLIEALARSRTLAEAGRVLFDGRRTGGASVNHSDRARKLCARMKVDPAVYLKRA